MAWSDQCKISFAVTVRAKRNRGVLNRSVNSIIKEISKESGIPASTLRHWWAEYSKKLAENGQHDATNQNDNENTEKDTGCAGTKKPLPTCRNEGCDRPVKIHSDTGRPYTTKYKFYGLCSTCVSRAYDEIKRNKSAKTEGGISVTFSRCGHLHYINQPN